MIDRAKPIIGTVKVNESNAEYDVNLNDIEQRLKRNKKELKNFKYYKNLNPAQLKIDQRRDPSSHAQK